jgi:micrococcal nuclease
MKNSNYLYHYKAFISAAYDGDTVTADIDLGLKTVVKGETLRLNRINTPEVRGAEREAVLIIRDWLRERIVGRTVMIETFKDSKGKYGRYIAEIWLPENDGYTNISDELVARGFAVYKDY